MCLLQVAASRLDDDWSVSAGDVTAAFLNGDPLERRLFLRQPRHGLPGLHPSQIIQVNKGVFGLIDSPRMWWRKFKKDIQQQVINVGEGAQAKFFASPLDPCVFQLLLVGEHGKKLDGAKPLCYAAVHVDDILLVGPRTLSRSVQEQLSTCFPVEEWENDAFDFIGSHIEVLKDEIRISQGGYVESRLFEVDLDPKVPDEAKATPEQVADNRSLIGALSWLASQTRPDLACGVSMAQQLQACPTVEDIKFTNLLARRALQHGQEAIVLKKINLDKLVVAVFHDAGWANAPDCNQDPIYFLSPSDEERGEIHDGPWATKERRAKRKNSRVASQLGMLVMFTETGALQGDSANASIVEWKSHACDRVCRSTFGAETMGCIEGIELAHYVRAMIASFLTGDLNRHTGEEYPMVAMTDCRSLYDHFHKDGLPRTPSDRRLAIDIACLRQTLQHEARGHGGGDERAPLVWVASADPIKFGGH
ncbi:RE1 [Symbiodinium sp. CCMP2456]|nr:RE1 [Symbiodinium sp. CCMP2456]